ncbi:MAG: SNF2-related protein, partial [Candidatus Cloacimonetes bacterium]|nr:SNF2-related protein [Candidatus Cloacimonadota bacterium]
MDTIDNISNLFGDDLKKEIRNNSKLKIIATTFSIYAFQELKKELSQIDELKFIFSTPLFFDSFVEKNIPKEERKFYIPTENSIYGTKYEVRLRNKLTLKAIAKECADWIREKVRFKSVKDKNFTQSLFLADDVLYSGFNGFTLSDFGYEKDDSLFRIINKINEPAHTIQYIKTFEQIWENETQLTDITERLLDHITNAYKENSPEYVYMIATYNIFSEFLNDLMDDTMPQEGTGFKKTKIWNTLYSFQRDGVIGIIDKLNKYNGCILADSVGLGKTFTALGVMSYFSKKNRNILVLCPKRLSDMWCGFKGNQITNIFDTDRISFDVLNHTDLSRKRGISNGMDLRKINWCNYDLIVIDESHNFRNINKGREGNLSRYEFLMEKIIKGGINTKVLMLSATPVNTKYLDLRNQLALAYEGDYDAFTEKVGTETNVFQVFKQTQKMFTAWSKLPINQRKNADLVNKLPIDFIRILDSVTIARSRKNITKYYNLSDIGAFPTRKEPLSLQIPISKKSGVILFKDILHYLTAIKLAVYSPLSFLKEDIIFKYIDTATWGDKAAKMLLGREMGTKYIMRANILKRLESSYDSLRQTLKYLIERHQNTLEIIEQFEKKGEGFIFKNTSYEDFYEEFDEDDIDDLENENTIKIDMKDMDITKWKASILHDLSQMTTLYQKLSEITSADDEKIKALQKIITDKIR